MQMTPNDIETIKPALLSARRAAGFHPQHLLSVREMWDVFHRAWSNGSLNGNELYKRYNDQNIETAMKKIFK